MTASAAIWTNPLPDETGTLDWLRENRERHPVCPGPHGAWHVFGYPEAVECLSNHVDFANNTGDVPEHSALKLFGKGNLAWMDPPEHRRLRSVVSKAFSVRFTAGLEPMVTAIATDHLERVRGRDRLRFIDEFVFPIALRSTAGLLGLPSAHYRVFGRWLKTLLMISTGTVNLMELFAALNREMEQVIHQVIAEQRAEPGDGLIGTLVTRQDPDLDDEVIAGLIALLMATGEGASTQTLANAALCLDEFPTVQDELRADPGLIESAVEEIARYRTQTIRVARRALRDTALGGRTIPAGAGVSVWLASANRDGRVFERPDEFDIRRHPNPHLGFGKGIHFCLGTPLGRLQVRVTLALLLRATRNLRVDKANTTMLDPRIIGGAREITVEADWAG